MSDLPGPSFERGRYPVRTRRSSQQAQEMGSSRSSSRSMPGLLTTEEEQTIRIDLETTQEIGSMDLPDISRVTIEEVPDKEAPTIVQENPITLAEPQDKPKTDKGSLIPLSQSTLENVPELRVMREFFNGMLANWNQETLKHILPRLEPLNRLVETTGSLEQIGRRQDNNIAQSSANAYHAYKAIQELQKSILALEKQIIPLPGTLTLLNTTLERQNQTLVQIHTDIQTTKQQIKDVPETLNTGLQGLREDLLSQKEENKSILEILQAIESKQNSREDIRPESRQSTFSNHFRLGTEVKDPAHSTTIYGARTTKEDLPKGARLKKPEAFSGKRGREAETYLMKMELYFCEYPNSFDDDRKIEAVLANMAEGEASQWAQPILLKQLNGTFHKNLQSWKTFKEAFLLSFSDPVKKEKAIQDITQLKQTGLAQRYATQFRNLMEEVNWDNHALID